MKLGADNLYKYLIRGNLFRTASLVRYRTQSVALFEAREAVMCFVGYVPKETIWSGVSSRPLLAFCTNELPESHESARTTKTASF